MKRFLLLIAVMVIYSGSFAQNVFNPSDPIIRYSATSAYGSAQRPDTSKPGLQKWVSTPVNGVSAGSSTFDVTSFKQYFINFNGTRIAFRLKFPRSYSSPDSAAKKYPVMMFLHGAGEVACSSNNGFYNNEKQLWLGGALFRDYVDQNKFDGFLLYPQLRNTDGCWGSWGSVSSAHLNTLMTIVDSMAAYIRADIDRLLINGLSGGGYGAWRLADALPKRITKIIPSAAAGNTNFRNNFVHIPIWFATGGKDPDPSPTQADYALNRMKEIGADIRYTRYADLGHSVWDRHWREPDYPAQMNDMHKANPLVFFQRNEFCVNEAINAKLGLTGGFYAYEWQRDLVTIATQNNNVNTIVVPQHVISFTGNEINVKSFGSYRVRFKRTATSQWSAFSLKPAIIKQKGNTVTPPITVSGLKSNALPSLDGSTTVPLQMPPNFLNYQWYRVSDSALVGTSQVFNAPVGTYIGRYSEQYGCGTTFSPNFIVVNANGSPKPDPVTNLTSTPLTVRTVRLNWSQGLNETGLEIYRATKAGGPFQFVSLRPANSITYTDTGLVTATTYYYVMRAVSGTGASAKSNETIARTLSDGTGPTAPSNLQYRGSTQNSVQLKWTASTDNIGLKRYDIFGNNVKLFSTTATSFNVINLDSLTTYNFVVRAVDVNDNISPPSNQVSAFTHRQGINYSYYATTANWTVLPNFTTLTPTSTGETDSVNISNTAIKTATSKYGFLWTGMIYIPATATYTFETVSDDGSKIYIDVPYSSTAVPLVSNDSTHGMRTRTGTRSLTQGYHTITITFFQALYGFGLDMYWSNNAGLARERIPKNFFSLQTGITTAAPAIPTSLTATANAYNRITLNWVDNSNNETGFEVVRSATSTGTYLPIGTTAPNVSAYLDSGLLSSRAYFYKLRAIGVGSESEYTAVATATTPAAPATPVAPTQLSAEGGANNVISLTWQDNSTTESGYRIYRSTNNTNFALIGSVGANSNAYTDVNATALTLYYYYVAGINAGGEGAKSNTVQVMAGNNVPVINSLGNIFAKTGQTVTEDFTVTDDLGDVLTVTIPRKPEFITLSNTGGANYRITVNPTNDNVGFYNIVLSAKDNSGVSSTDTFSITVADNNTRSVFLNFGATGKTAPAPWNNWLGNRVSGNIISNLLDENNIATTFSVTTINGWSTTTILGHITGNNSGVAPDAVLESGLADNGVAKTIRIGGLNPAKRYNLEFIGSQNEGLAATAQYTSGTQIAVLDARYNTLRTANLNSLVPDATGQLTITVTRTGTSAFAYLNGLVIEEVDPAITILNPEHLYAEPIDRTSISLSWSDRSANELVAGGFELQRARDSLFTSSVMTIPLPANTTAYNDAGLSSNTKYWYRVRAVSSNGVSQYSNKFTAVTPASIVYVNFNTTIANAPFPWNNLEATSMSQFVQGNLINQSGINSGIRITCLIPFNGEFTAGVNTGNNSGVVPDQVLMSDYWLDNTQLSQVKLSGLNHSRRYRIGFVGSSSTAGWFKGNYTATYTINGRTVYLNSWMNSTKIVYLSDIVPDANGEVIIDFSTTQIAQWGFNAGIIIQDYSDVNGGSVLYMSNTTLDTTSSNTAFGANEYKIKIYPNPFSDNMNIELFNPSASNRISVEIYDLNGSLVQKEDYRNISAGKNILKVDAIRTARNGMYIVALKINGKLVQSIKMLRSKK